MTKSNSSSVKNTILTLPRYLFLATDKILKVVGVRTGQIVRYLGVGYGKGRIVDFVLDPANEFRLLVVYNSRMLSIFDWTDGLLIMVPSTWYKMLK